MDDQHRQRLVEIYEGAALAILMYDAMEEDGKRLHEEFERAKANGEVPEVPASLDKKCLKLIDEAMAREVRRERMSIFLRASAKVAVTVLLLIGLSTVTILSVDALRVPVLNFLLDPSGKYQTVVMDPSQEVKTAISTVAGRLEDFIPSGYQQATCEYFHNNMGSISYTNDDKQLISLGYMPSTGIMNVDSEDTNDVAMTINGCAAVFLDKDGYYMLWLDENSNVAYTLYSDGLDEAAFMELAYAIIG